MPAQRSNQPAPACDSSGTRARAERQRTRAPGLAGKQRCRSSVDPHILGSAPELADLRERLQQQSKRLPDTASRACPFEVLSEPGHQWSRKT